MAIKYVRSTGGSDSNNGFSFIYGWATLDWAFNALNTNRMAYGDTLAICGDTGSNVFNLTSFLTIQSYTATNVNPIYVKGYSMQGLPLTNGNFVKITTSTNLACLFYCVSSNWIKFSNILFDGGGSGGATYGFYGNIVVGLVFDNCRFTNCASYGVFYANGTTSIGNLNKFLQCEMDNNGKAGAAGGMYAVPSIYVNSCRIHDNNGPGIQCNDYIFLLNNLFYKNLGHGMSFPSSGVSHIKNNVFFGNTGSGLYFSVNAYPLNLYNNIFRSNGQYGISGGWIISHFWSNNCAHNNTSGPIDVNGGVLPGTGNITSNPLFMSETAGSENFTLQSTSPCINAGYNPLA